MRKNVSRTVSRFGGKAPSSCCAGSHEHGEAGQAAGGTDLETGSQAESKTEHVSAPSHVAKGGGRKRSALLVMFPN